MKIVDAIELAAAARLGEPLPEPDRSGRVGSRSARYKGVELALGDQPFVGDMTVPGMLHCALRFSDHPRARVLRIDTSQAKAHPGVVAALTADDVPGDRKQGSITRDWRQLVAVGETTAYVGDVLAVVAAETRHAAREAAALIEVEYEVLDPVTDPFDALADGAPLLHEGGNVLSVSRVQRGDVDAALAASAHVATGSYRTQVIEHAFLEPESSLAVPGRERAAARLLAGPGHLGRPPPDRVVPRPAGGRGARHAGLDGRRLRGEGGSERPVPRCARSPRQRAGRRC